VNLPALLAQAAAESPAKPSGANDGNPEFHRYARIP
jgi:hypothetical protein